MGDPDNEGVVRTRYTAVSRLAQTELLFYVFPRNGLFPVFFHTGQIRPGLDDVLGIFNGLDLRFTEALPYRVGELRTLDGIELERSLDELFGGHGASSVPRFTAPGAPLTPRAGARPGSGPCRPLAVPAPRSRAPAGR